VCAGLDFSSGVCWPGESHCLGMLFVSPIDWQIFQLPPTSPIRYKKGYTCGKDIDFYLAMVVWQEIIDYNSALVVLLLSYNCRQGHPSYY